MDINAIVNSPALPRIVKALEALVNQNADLRELQSNNAPFAKYVTNFAAVNTLRIEEAQSGGQVFSGVSIFFFQASGAGLYNIAGGQDPKIGPPVVGIEIPAGGALIELQGQNNIAAFRAIGNGGTLTGAYVLFV